MNILFPLLLAFLLEGTIDAKPSELRIINGNPVKEHEFPFLVFLKIDLQMIDEETGTMDESTATCGGSLITRQHVLSAAHCVVSSDPTSGEVYYKARPEDVRAYVGGFDVSHLKSDYRQPVQHVQYHKDYVGSSYVIINDLSLMTFFEPVTETPAIKTIYLPPRQQFSEYHKKATIIGWGRISNSDPDAYPSYPLKMNTTVIMTEPGMIEVEAEDQSSCHGDSGGPVVVNSAQKKNILIATVSHGFPSESSRGKVDCPVGDFQRVACMKIKDYSDWIEEQVRKSGTQFQIQYLPVNKRSNELSEESSEEADEPDGYSDGEYEAPDELLEEVIDVFSQEPYEDSSKKQSDEAEDELTEKKRSDFSNV